MNHRLCLLPAKFIYSTGDKELCSCLKLQNFLRATMQLRRLHKQIQILNISEGDLLKAFKKERRFSWRKVGDLPQFSIFQGT